MPDGRRIRGDIHLILVGDPGTAKSELLSYMSRLSPRGIYATGKAATAAGLTATATRDEFGEGRWTLEAGALVLADKGLACLHPDSEVIVSGVPVPIHELFADEMAVSAATKGRPIEIAPLVAETPSLDMNSFESCEASVAVVARRRYSGPMVHVTLDSGFELRLTPDHIVLEGKSLKWRRLEELTPASRLVAFQQLPQRRVRTYILDIIPEDWIVRLTHSERAELRTVLAERFGTLLAAYRRYGLHRDALSAGGTMQVGPLRAILRDTRLYDTWKENPMAFGRSRSTERLRLAAFGPELGYLIGFLRGDEHASFDERGSSLSVSRSDQSLAQIRKVLETAQRVTGRTWKLRLRGLRSRTQGREARARAYYAHKTSDVLAHLYRWTTEKDFANLLRLDDESLRGFLAGLLDSDGCVSVKKSSDEGRAHANADIEFVVSSSKKANLRLLHALRRFDVFGRVRTAERILRIQITSGTDVQRLRSAVSEQSVKWKPVPPRPQEDSSRHEEPPRIPVLRFLRTTPPRATEALGKGLWSTSSDLRRRTRAPVQETMRELASGLRPRTTEDEYRQFVMRGTRDFALERIKAIRVEDFQGYVYDLRVPSTENFLCDGVCVHNCIDEIDKMNPQDRSAIHEALEQQRISVAKAGITAVLQARCAVLAAANPKFGRFDEHKYISEQIDLPPALLSRFDGIFSLIDRPEAEKDRQLAEHVLRGHKVGEIIRRREEGMLASEAVQLGEPYTPHFTPDFLRKYVAYAKRIFPIMSDEAMEGMKRKYLDVRKTGEAAGSPGDRRCRQRCGRRWW